MKVKNNLFFLGALAAISLFAGIGVTSSVKLATVFKSAFAHFSLAGVLMPLSGLFGLGGIATTVFMRVSWALLFAGASYKAVTFYIPTLFSSFYWSHKTKLLSVVLPVVCMFLFCIHPVGMQAAPYSAYWLVPMLLAFSGYSNPFVHSLISTFIAHAVGSVMWLYLGPASTSAQWYALLPVVAVERFTFALLMTAAYLVASFIKETLFSWVFSDAAEHSA